MILFLTHADTEILGLRVVSEGLPEGFPGVRAANPALLRGVPSLEGIEAVIVRLLGGRRSWEPFDSLAAECRRREVPLLCFGGEAVPDADMMSASTVPGGIVTQAFEYLVQGGTENLEQMIRFVADTVLRHGFGFDPPAAVPVVGVFGDPRVDAGRPTVGIVFYRAHVLTGNTTFVSDLCAAVEAAGCNAVPVYCYSLREGSGAGSAGATGSAVAELLASFAVDVVITTVLAAGTFAPGGAVAEGWEEQALARLGVPVLQAIASSSSSQDWSESSAGLAPLDVAWQVALPELDGRIIGVPFSFKETVDDGDDLGAAVVAYRCLPDRLQRIAGLACRLASLHLVAPADRKLVVVLSAYPTSRSRLGNAVGLDTPASLIDLLGELRAAGYRVDRIPVDGDALMAELADGLAYDSEALPAAAAERALGTMGAAEYRRWFATLPASVRAELEAAWGRAPGTVHVTADGSLAFSGIDLGGVVVAIQPPRGFGEAPIAIYHSPDAGADAPLPRLLPVDRPDPRRARRHPSRQARHARVAAGQERRPLVGLLPRHRPRRPALHLPVRRQRPRRGCPGEAAFARRRRRPSRPPAHPGRRLRRHRPPRATARPARPSGLARPVKAPGRPPPSLGAARGRRDPS